MLRKKTNTKQQNCSNGIRTLSVNLQGRLAKQRLYDHGYVVQSIYARKGVT
jgi:hypothetical protein